MLGFKVLRILLFLTKLMGMFPYKIDDNSGCCSCHSHRPTSHQNPKSDLLSSGSPSPTSASPSDSIPAVPRWKRSWAWVAWSVVVLLTSLVASILVYCMPSMMSFLPVSSAMSTAQNIALHSNAIITPVLLIYQSYRSSLLARIVTDLRHNIVTSGVTVVWSPLKDWFFLLLSQCTLFPFILCTFVMHNVDSVVQKTINLSISEWALMAFLCGKNCMTILNMVCLLYVLAQFLANCYGHWAAQLSMKTRFSANIPDLDIYHIPYDGAKAAKEGKLGPTEVIQQRDWTSDEGTRRIMYENAETTTQKDYWQDDPVTLKCVQRACQQLMALHRLQLLVNDYFSLAMVLVLLSVLINTVTIIFFQTSDGPNLPHLFFFSFPYTMQCVFLIVLTCCSPEALVKQVSSLLTAVISSEKIFCVK